MWWAWLQTRKPSVSLSHQVHRRRTHSASLESHAVLTAGHQCKCPHHGDSSTCSQHTPAVKVAQAKTGSFVLPAADVPRCVPWHMQMAQAQAFAHMCPYKRRRSLPRLRVPQVLPWPSLALRVTGHSCTQSLSCSLPTLGRLHSKGALFGATDEAALPGNAYSRQQQGTADAGSNNVLSHSRSWEATCSRFK